jgi:adenylylsulfate kinase-like enzyme
MQVKPILYYSTRLKINSSSISTLSVITVGNFVWHLHPVTKQSRSKQKKQQPCVFWFTGLSGAGKSSIADAAEIVIKSTEFGIEECADQIIHYMQTNQLIFSD